MPSDQRPQFLKTAATAAAPSCSAMEGRPAVGALARKIRAPRRPSVESVEQHRPGSAAPLRRRGFWRLLEREADWLPPWRDLLRVYRTLEARRRYSRRAFCRRFFRVSNTRYPDAVGMLREIRRKPDTGALDRGLGCRSAEFSGYSHAGAEARGTDRQPFALFATVCRSATLAGGEVQFLETLDAASEWQARKTLLRGPVPPHARRSRRNRRYGRFRISPPRRRCDPGAIFLSNRRGDNFWSCAGIAPQHSWLYGFLPSWGVPVFHRSLSAIK